MISCDVSFIMKCPWCNENISGVITDMNSDVTLKYEEFYYMGIYLDSAFQGRFFWPYVNAIICK